MEKAGATANPFLANIRHWIGLPAGFLRPVMADAQSLDFAVSPDAPVLKAGTARPPAGQFRL